MSDLQIYAVFFRVCRVESELGWDEGRQGGENTFRVGIQMGLCLGVCVCVWGGWM